MTFPARYEGECVGCKKRFDPGDLIALNDDGFYVHAECDVKPPKPMPVCPTCFIEMPATGVCDQCQ